MQIKCPLCDSTQFKKYGKTANGSRKYCCEICNNIIIDDEHQTFCQPKINFLRFRKKRLIRYSANDSQDKIFKFNHLIIIQKEAFKKINEIVKLFLSKVQVIIVGLVNFLVSSLISLENHHNQRIFFLFRKDKIHKKWIHSYLLRSISRFLTKERKKHFHKWEIVGLLVSLCIYSFMCIWLKIDVNQPQPFDSYTLQALAWRSGNLNLPQDYNWLEIAMYQGKYYLSFPPVPTIPMLFLTFFFGERTPSTWLMIVCFFSSYCLAYKLLRRFQNSDFDSAVWAVFLICGSSYLDISLFGWVWYMAQSMSFVLTLACILCLTYKSRKIQGIGLFCFSLTVGCRPLQALYTLLILGFIYTKNRQLTFLQTIKVIIPMLIAPSLVVISLGILNFLRFNSALEFGHNYLPVLLAEPQFSLSYVHRNFLRLTTVFPTINSSGHLDLPRFGGFAFYIANPIFVILVLRLINRWTKSKIDWILLGMVMLHFFVLMMHITFGAWQFGTRFLVDMLPAVLVLCTRVKQSLKLYEVAIIILGLAFNIYGGIIFRTTT